MAATPVEGGIYSSGKQGNRRFRRRVSHAAAAALAIVLMIGTALAANGHAADAAQGSPTPTPVVTAAPEGSEPLTQTDLVWFTGDVARPNGMTWLGDLIYVICEGDKTIYKMYGTSGETDTYIYGILDAYTIYAEEESGGNVLLWVPDYKAGKLLLVTVGGVETIASALAGPWGLVPLGSTYFLVSDSLSGTVELVSRTGEVETFVDGLARPTGLEYDGSLMYVANSGSAERAIEWYELAAVRGDEPHPGDVLVRGLDNVMGLRIGPDGKLYFAYDEGGLGLIGRVDPAACQANGGCDADQIERVVVSELDAPLAGLAFSPDGRLFFHERYGDRLYWAEVIEE
ncbi:MAG TPA: hypothetical protein PKD09_17495 [Aggregatilinea sp.]|uniref:hypothetical protein n=1 Tax=Aggregatilinea sp. TaxID=2806333 RepID=UPI002C078844|nr:hypothetical protein [Aggregatilinea sp.]HML23454.1 hypothetical protein [Aggregatilinea sp.]